MIIYENKRVEEEKQGKEEKEKVEEEKQEKINAKLVVNLKKDAVELVAVKEDK